MPFITFDKKTLDVLSVGKSHGEHYVEISQSTFDDILSGRLRDIIIVKHPTKDFFTMSTHGEYEWFDWINNCVNLMVGSLYISRPFKSGQKIVIAKRGNGNMIHLIHIVEQACDNYKIDDFDFDLSDVDIFVSKV